MGFRSCWSSRPFRVIAVGLAAGLLLTGCGSEYIRELRSSARELRSSDEFAAVNFEYERSDPIAMPRSIYDYSAALHEDADLQEAGRLLANAAERTGSVPDIQVDGTWLNSFDDGAGSRRVPSFTAQEWTEILAAARATPADELQIWQLDEYFVEDPEDGEPELLLTVYAETLTEGLEQYEQLDGFESPAGIEKVAVELHAGTDRLPWVYEEREVGDRYHTNSGAPISIVALEQSNLAAARELFEAGQASFGEIYQFHYHYADVRSTLEVVHAGDPEACQDNKAYAELARELLTTDLDVAITLSQADGPDTAGTRIYEETETGESPPNANPHGCSIEG